MDDITKHVHDEIHCMLLAIFLTRLEKGYFMMTT